MKYYIFSRYRQEIDVSWIREQLKQSYYYWGAFNTAEGAEKQYSKLWKQGGLAFLDSDYGIFSVNEKNEWFRCFIYNGKIIKKRRME